MRFKLYLGIDANITKVATQSSLNANLLVQCAYIVVLYVVPTGGVHPERYIFLCVNVDQ